MTEKVLSSAMEDYLKAIYELGEQGVKTQSLADTLGISPASVTGMVQKLAKLNLVVYTRYRGVDLTDAGRKVALETLRHHRLLETYLAQALGYPWHEVHDEAEKLEHVISEDFEQRIAEALGHPNYDVHGDPIPALDGSLPAALGQSLSAFQRGQHVEITRITRQDTDALRYLAEQGLLPGSSFHISDKARMDGPITLRRAHDDSPVVIGFDLAQDIHARLLP